MKVATRSSAFGLGGIALAFTSLHYFSVQVRAGAPELSIPIGALFLFGAISASICLFLNLQKQSRFTEFSNASVVFCIGFCIAVALAAAGVLGMPRPAMSLPVDLLSDPASSVPGMLVQLRTELANAHWWVHLALALSLLCALITCAVLLAMTDIAGALGAAVLGPFYGLVAVGLIAAAATVLFALAAGAAVLAIAWLKLALLAEQ